LSKHFAITSSFVQDAHLTIDDKHHILTLLDAFLYRDIVLKLATEKFDLTPLINRFLLRI